MVLSRKKSPPTPSIVLQGETIELVSSFKLLGVIISRDLTWRSHISYIISKAKRLLGFLYRTFKEGGRHCLSQLYKAVVLPHLDYCSCVWDPTHKTHSKSLERVQSFAAHITTNGWSLNAADLREDLLWPVLESRCLYQKLCRCYEILHSCSIIPPSFFKKHPRPTSHHQDSIPLYHPFV